MARPRKTGINVAWKTLADGTRRAYYYDRATGAALGTDRDTAVRLATVQVVPAEVAPGTVAALIAAYKSSPKWKTKLSDGTKEGYLRHFDFLQAEFGDIPVAAFKPRHVATLQKRFEAQPRKANYLTAVLRLLFNFAVRQGMAETNPAAKPEMFNTPPRTEIWTREDETEFLSVADPRLHLGFLLMLYTAQRLSDVLAMTKGHIYEREGRLRIALRQHKTNALVDIPVHPNLIPLIAARMAETTGGLLLVPSPRGLAWRRRNFSRKWDDSITKLDGMRSERMKALGWAADKIAAELDSMHRQRRDLRRTAVVRMAEVGLPATLISQITGHKIDYCQSIIDTYLPRRTEVATAAMDAWIEGEQTAARRRVVVPLRPRGKE